MLVTRWLVALLVALGMSTVPLTSASMAAEEPAKVHKEPIHLADCLDLTDFVYCYDINLSLVQVTTPTGNQVYNLSYNGCTRGFVEGAVTFESCYRGHSSELTQDEALRVLHDHSRSTMTLSGYKCTSEYHILKLGDEFKFIRTVFECSPIE